MAQQQQRWRGNMQVLATLIVVLNVVLSRYTCQAWTLSFLPSGSTRTHNILHHRATSYLEAVKQSRKSSGKSGTATVEKDAVASDEPAGIAGAEFFGGNKEKEEFFDADAEENAGLVVLDTTEDQAIPTIATESAETTKADDSFDRFADRKAFETQDEASVARQVQLLINEVLYEDAESIKSANSLSYSSSVGWTSPLKEMSGVTTPLNALVAAMDQYRRLDVAITAGRSVSTDSSSKSVELQWEISLAWSTFWEPRVLITGSSMLDVQGPEIVKQVDRVYGTNGQADQVKDKVVVDQLLPRFWDVYHIGMTPSAEKSPQMKSQGGFGYDILELPGRWMVTSSLVDVDNERDQALAGTLPSHAFNTIIKTMGPTKQRYVPTSPLEVQIQTSATRGAPVIQWRVPVSVEFQSQLSWPTAFVPTENDEAVLQEGSSPACEYTWHPSRRVAVTTFGGGPQDESIPDVRRRLYQSVVDSGKFKPRMDDSGRPIFSFWKNAFKGCYTEEGLGMAVYEWRPAFVKSNQVGIELEE